MAFPAISDIERIFQQLPVVGDSTIQLALSAAKKTLAPDRQRELGNALNTTLREYLLERLWYLWSAKAPAGKGARQLEKIATAADKLVTLLGARDGFDSMIEMWRLILSREAENYAESIGGFKGLAPMEFPAYATGEKRVRKWYQGKVKLRECIDDLLLLNQLLKSAHSYELRKVTPKIEKNRRAGDEHMKKLFNNLNGIWFEILDEIPGASWNAYAGDAGGPYVGFLLTIFRSLKADMPASVLSEYPKLARGLPTTAQAIRARIRASDRKAIRRVLSMA